MNQRQTRAGANSRSALSLAIALAIPAFALTVPGVAHAGATQVLCPSAVTLSGGPVPAEQISVDDDLELRLNGDPFFVDANGFAQDHDPIGFTAELGDRLRVIATNGAFGGPEHIDPLYLTCDANNEQQVLDDTGFDAPDGAVGHVFYNEAFTINLGSPQTTITKRPKKRSQKRRATFRFVGNPASGAEFECKLDRKQPKPCDSPYKKRVRPGRHKFTVRATVEGVSDPTPARFKWRVIK